MLSVCRKDENKEIEAGNGPLIFLLNTQVNQVDSWGNHPTAAGSNPVHPVLFPIKINAVIYLSLNCVPTKIEEKEVGVNQNP